MSLDLFDTLLVRPYMKVADIFVHLERQYNSQDFSNQRKKAELQAKKKRQSEKCTLEEIYAEIPNYQYMMQHEMNMEKQTAQINPEISEVLKFAEQQKKTVIVTADTYYSPEFIH